MSQGAAKTFNRSLSVGAGFFGSTSKRDALSSPLPGADTPGPGAYEVAKPARIEAAQSAAFASQSKRDVHLQSSSSQSPGVGTYTPRHGSGPKGGAAVFKSSEPRFKHDREAALMAEIGPGSYSQVRSGHSVTLCWGGVISADVHASILLGGQRRREILVGGMGVHAEGRESLNGTSLPMRSAVGFGTLSPIAHAATPACPPPCRPHLSSQHNGTINASMRGAGANLSTAFASTTLRDFF